MSYAISYYYYNGVVLSTGEVADFDGFVDFDSVDEMYAAVDYDREMNAEYNGDAGVELACQL